MQVGEPGQLLVAGKLEDLVRDVDHVDAYIHHLYDLSMQASR
jgi:hypothetical protein